MLANVRWQKPLVAIIDEGTRSGLEVFAYALQANDIRLVGSRTRRRAACRPSLSAAGRQPARNRGFGCGDRRRRRLEGVGVEPDVAVEFSLPYAAGKDPQREAAIEEMRRILAEG